MHRAMAGKVNVIWLYWLFILGGLSAYLAYALKEDAAAVYLIGDVTHGHHQIQLACDSCHGESFGGGEVLQSACVSCHGEALRTANDKHPKSKFTDPRNAERVAVLDARYCVTCHVEHRPENTRPMGVTLPDDFCVLCHSDIGHDRPSHAELEFGSCASAGCHNFHDNQALYEDFLLKHQGEPANHPLARVPVAVPGALVTAIVEGPVTPLTAAAADVPADQMPDQRLLYDWETTAHAQAGVNCRGCHADPARPQDATAWIERPDQRVCETCHTSQVKGFLAGLHGMRLAAGLPPMQPGMAQLPMQEKAHARELSCSSCHAPHRYARKQAAVEACLDCHADEHSLNYAESSHAALWRAEQSGDAAAGSGVSCATCHMPRDRHKLNGVEVVLTRHNQSDSLRPNEKMLRDVCMNCHGLAFAIDALADPALIATNFNGQPARHIPGIDWAAQRVVDKVERHR